MMCLAKRQINRKEENTMMNQAPKPRGVAIYSRYGPIAKTIIFDEQELLAACRAGKYERLLVKNHRHLARNAQDLLRLTREVQGLGVPVHFEQEGLVV